MAGDFSRASAHPVPLSPEELRRRTFTNSFRGYDPGEVRELIDFIAAELDRLIRSEEALRRELEGARQAAVPPRLDEATLTAALGHEAAQILHSAHEASAELRRKAEDNAARILKDAQAQADAARHAGELLLGERTREADSAAEAIRAAAQAEAHAVVARARQQAETALTEARIRFDAMAEEAEALKVRVLGDLTRRRRTVLAQVEQLGAGRDSMLRAVADVRRLIDQVTGSLEGLESEAKAAADNALERARRAEDVDAPVIEELAQAALGAGSLGEPPPPPESVEQPLYSQAVAETTPLRIHATPAAAPSGVQPFAEPPSTGAITHPDAPISASIRIVAEPRGTDDSDGLKDQPDTIVAERRISSLRILRRRDERRHPSADLQSEPEEGVRIIRPAPAPEPTPPAEADIVDIAGVSEAPAPEMSPQSPPPVVSAVEVPPPAAAWFEETASEPSAFEPAEAEPAETEARPYEPAEAEAAASEPAESEPAESEPAEAETAASEPAEARSSVDELFARLRAERQVARAEAEAVLAGITAQPGDDGSEIPPGATDMAVAGSAGEDGEIGEVGEVGESDEAPGEAGADDLLERRNRLAAPVQDRLSRKLKRALQDDQNDLLDRVRSRSRHPDDDPLPTEVEHAARFRLAAAEVLNEAFASGVEYAQAVVPGATPADDPAGAAQAAVLAEDLVGELRARLRRALGEPGLDDVGLVDSVGSVYRAWKGARAEGLAMDHVVACFGRGVMAAAPAGTHFNWVVDDDGGPCPDCDDNSLAGPTSAGEAFPTGQIHPPAHAGCRCLLVPGLT